MVRLKIIERFYLKNTHGRKIYEMVRVKAKAKR